jgi:hypothetical protein
VPPTPEPSKSTVSEKETLPVAEVSMVAATQVVGRPQGLSEKE